MGIEPTHSHLRYDALPVKPPSPWEQDGGEEGYTSAVSCIGVGTYWRLEELNIQLRAKCARKIYGHAHFMLNHAHFCTIEAAITSFLMKNLNVSRIENRFGSY